MANNIGGQAVLEGVMMRSPSMWAVAVRKPDGQIAEEFDRKMFVEKSIAAEKGAAG